jgi:glycosyltransferase involved in cell wall biosynthesis
MVGIEAMSYGKPVVAFNVGGIPEWLEHRVTGFLVKPYDVKAMAENIDFLLENPTIAQKMGEMGRKQVELLFSKENHINRLLEIYRQVINGWRVT